MVAVSGFTTFGTERAYTVQGIPLLQSFYLRFSNEDRHLLALGVEPESSRDRIAIYYYDDSRNDEFFYNVRSFDMPASLAEAASHIDYIRRGQHTVPISRPGANFEFVLVGFSFYFPNGDNHIDEIGLLEENGQLTAYFNDRSDSDLFRWEAHYAWVPSSRFQNMGTASGERARGNRGDATQPIPGGIRVVRGFRLNFQPYFTRGNDHHLREIGVLTEGTNSGNLEVYYSDRNGDDGFDWEVRWGTILPIEGLPPFVPVGEMEIRRESIPLSVSERFVNIEQELRNVNVSVRETDE